LVLEVPTGTRVVVDGVASDADAPPLTSVTPIGEREIEVGANGHDAWRGRVPVEAGAVRRFSPPLEETPQRLGSYGLMGLAGASAATAIALGVVSVVRAREAEEAVRRLQDDDLEEFARLRGLADDFRLGSGIAGGGALVTFVLGVSLFAFDEPTLTTTVSADSAQVQLGGSF
jgi:hypothetical protein